MTIPQKIRDLERFCHIIEAIELIENYAGDTTKELSPMAADAIFYRLQIIGEASKHISDTYKEKFSDIPWRKIIAMRNYLVHECFSIHNNKIMAAVADIPRIKNHIQDIIREIEND